MKKNIELDKIFDEANRNRHMHYMRMKERIDRSNKTEAWINSLNKKFVYT